MLLLRYKLQENIIKILQQSGLDAPLEERLFLDELPDSEKMNDDVTTSSKYCAML